MRPTGSPEELERRRLRALALLKEGLLPSEVGKRVGVDRRSVRRWKAAARDGGEQGVRARPASGRPPKLAAKDKRKLEGLLLKGPVAAGFGTDLWTCPRVAETEGTFPWPQPADRLVRGRRGDLRRRRARVDRPALRAALRGQRARAARADPLGQLRRTRGIGKRARIRGSGRSKRQPQAASGASARAARSDDTTITFMDARVRPTNSLRCASSSKVSKSTSVRITHGADWPLKR